MLKNNYKLWVVTLAFMLTQVVFADSPPLTITKTKSQIRELEFKIAGLQQNLTKVKNKNALIQSELAKTDKQMSQGVLKLAECKKAIEGVEKDIALAKRELETLVKDLQAAQKQLAQHVAMRYQMGTSQPIKWILNQQNPYDANRLLTYYQYIIQSRQDLIVKMEATRKNMDIYNQKLMQNLLMSKQLHEEQMMQQEKLEKEKSYRLALLQISKKDIQNHEYSLEDARHNKQDLEKLLYSFMDNNSHQPSKPFQLMRKKLPYPIQARIRNFQKMNQGVTFFADEGAPISAIYPGKVVFSDWLKGYGLLLIIDHGQGFMTLYAYNQALFVHKGQRVKQGSVIASVGHTGGLNQNGLYFEVRHKGKAVSPLEWFS